MSVYKGELYKTIWNICHEEGPCLCPIELPTGSGKSTAVDQVIIDYIKGAENGTEEQKKFFIITTKLDNLKQSLKPILENVPKEKVLHLYSLRQTLSNYYNAISNGEITVPSAITQDKSYKDVRKAFDSSNDDDKDKLYEVFPKFYKQLYKFIKSQYASSHKHAPKDEDVNENEVIASFIQETESLHFVYKLFPAMLVPMADVILMSVDKLYYPLHTPTQYFSHLYDADFFKNSVIFFDESDADVVTLKKDILENVSKNNVNLITMLKAFAESSRSAGELSRLSGLSTNYITKRQKIIRDVYDKYHVQNTFQTDSQIRNTANDQFLFKSGNASFCSYGLKLYLHLGDTVNEIYAPTITEVNGKKELQLKNKDDILLTDAASEITHVLEHTAINNFVYRLATGYYKNCKRLHPNDPTGDISYENAFQSILDFLGIPETISKYIVNNFFMGTGHEEDSTERAFDRSFYSRGYSIHVLKDGPSHNENTFIEWYRCFTTPETIMAHLAEQAKVLLISATATHESAISNIDLKWMEQHLGTIYRPLTDKEQQALRTEYQTKTSYIQDGKVKLVPKFLENMQGELSISETQKLFVKREGSLNTSTAFGTQLKNRIEASLTSLSPKKKTFYAGRYLKIFQAYQFFIVNHIESMLVVGNQYWGNESNFSTAVIHDGFALINKFYQVPTDSTAYFQLNGKLNQDDIDRAFTDGRKCFVYTVYQRSGVGRNLQHKYDPSIQSSLVRVNNHDDQGTKDYDAVAVLAPTHVIPTKEDCHDNEHAIDLLNALYIIEALQDPINGELTEKEAKQAINAIFSSSGKYDEAYAELRKTRSCLMSKAAILTQAVGRMGRTCWRAAKEYILLDIDASSAVAELDPSHGIYTPELLKLIDYCQDYQKSMALSETTSSASDTMTTVEQNVVKVSNHTDQAIHSLMTRNDDGEFQYPVQWEELRKACMTAVTTPEDYRNLPRIGRQLAYYHVDGLDIDHYTYDAHEIITEKGKRYITDRVSLSDDVRYSYVVSETADRLASILLIPGMKEYFEANHYRTDLHMVNYLIPPVINQNILKAAMSEYATLFVCQKVGIELDSIKDRKKYELFDFVVKDTNIYIDCKNYSEHTIRFDKDVLYGSRGGIEKAKVCGADTIIYINLVAANSDYRIMDQPIDGIRVVELPSMYLIKDGKAIRNDKCFDKLLEVCHVTE